MNIRQAIYQNLAEATIVDSYYGKIMVKGSQKTYVPVDFRLKKGKISIPLKDNDISFEYRVKTESTNVCKGEYILTKYYPVGTIITINEMKLKILSYGETTTISSVARVPIYTVSVNDDEHGMIEVISNKSVEDKIKREIESILISNEIIKRKLPYYKYDWLDYTEENISAYDECVSLKKLFDIKFDESIEYEYRMNDMNMALNQETYHVFSEAYHKFMERVNYEKMRIKYNRGAVVFNLISIMKWILLNREFKTDRLYLQNGYKDFCKLRVNKGVNNSIVIYIETPDYSFYNYRIELINVVKCNINKVYYEYIMDNIRVSSLTKGCCVKEAEIINLTGEGSNISTSIKRLRPYSFSHDIYICINNCQPGSCSSTANGYCINDCKCETTDPEVIIPGDIINGDNVEFNNTFFNILCEIIRHICASCKVIKESGASCKDEYYGLLNNNLIELINKFRDEIGEEGTYSNTAEEFLTKYSTILSKTYESILIADKNEVIEAIDDYIHLPEEEQSKVVEQKEKLDSFLIAIEKLENNDTSVEDADSPANAFITVDTIEARDALPSEELVDGKLVRVNDNGFGEVAYYSYDSETGNWIEEDFIDDSIEETINDLADSVDELEENVEWNNLTVEE